MAITPFLAMTAAEMHTCASLPPKIAWMACHFSPYGLGLSNLPQSLPAGSMLILDDMTPPRGHDPERIADQLSTCMERFRCEGILLDFQRADSEETQIIAAHLVSTLPCPVVVSDYYAQDLNCPVFLPPVPPSVPLEAHIASWKDREIWLELGLDGEILTLTEEGCFAVTLPCPDLDATGFSDEQLHCHYSIETNENTARFTLWRTEEDLKAFLEKAKILGIVKTIGLFQEISTPVWVPVRNDMRI